MVYKRPAVQPLLTELVILIYNDNLALLICMLVYSCYLYL